MTWDNTPRRPPTGACALPASDLLAAVDLGSNGFRLEIARFQAGQYRGIATFKESVRLGFGLDAQRRLCEDAMRRGIACLEGFGRRLESFGVQRVRAVATQTLREARNREDFLRRGAEALGHPIRTITGHEEARLIYAGVTGLRPAAGRRLVLDIGGRSTEVILGEGARLLAADSFPVGSGNLSMRFFPEGRFTPEAFRDAEQAAATTLERGRAAFAGGRWREALGASGTVGAVSQLLAVNGVTDGALTADGLRWCIERCIEAGSAGRLKLPGLRTDRRDNLGGGLSLLKALLTRLRIEALRPTEGALRQGVIFDLARQPPAAGTPARPELAHRSGTRLPPGILPVGTAAPGGVAMPPLAALPPWTPVTGGHAGVDVELPGPDGLDPGRVTHAPSLGGALQEAAPEI